MIRHWATPADTAVRQLNNRRFPVRDGREAVFPKSLRVDAELVHRWMWPDTVDDIREDDHWP